MQCAPAAPWTLKCAPPERFAAENGVEKQEAQAIASLVRKIEEQLIELRGAEIANTLAVRALIDSQSNAEQLRAAISADLGAAWPADPQASAEERALRKAVQKTLKQLGCALPTH